MSADACILCGTDPAGGAAWIYLGGDDQPLCHEGPSPTCYETFCGFLAEHHPSHVYLDGVGREHPKARGTAAPIAVDAHPAYQPDLAHPRVVNGFVLSATSGCPDTIVPLSAVRSVYVRPPVVAEPFSGPRVAGDEHLWLVIADCLGPNVTLWRGDDEAEARAALRSIWGRA